MSQWVGKFLLVKNFALFAILFMSVKLNFPQIINTEKPVELFNVV